jgi:ELWxxDGT repeat protein
MRRREFVELVGGGAVSALCGCGAERFAKPVFYRVTDEVGLGATYFISRCSTSADYRLTRSIFAAGGRGLLFKGNATGRDGLWFTDGTAAGTRFLSAFSNQNNPIRAIHASPGDSVFHLTAGRDHCSYPNWTPPDEPVELWRGDLSTGAFERVCTLPDLTGYVPLANGWVVATRSTIVSYIPSAGASPVAIAAFPGVGNLCLGPRGEALFFVSGSAEIEGLWCSNGTRAGTRLLAPVSGAFAPRSVGGFLFFASPQGLWATDGTAAGTRLLCATCGSLCGNCWYFQSASLGGRLVFSVHEPLSRIVSLGLSDGTAAGTRVYTQLPADTVWNAYDLRLDEAVELDGCLYFLVSGSSVRPRALWRTDGTAAGTTRVRTGEGQGSEDIVRHEGELLVFENYPVNLGETHNNPKLYAIASHTPGVRQLATLPAEIAHALVPTSVGERVVFGVNPEGAYGKPPELWAWGPAV